MSNGSGHESNLRISEKLWNLSSFVGPSWLSWLYTKQDIIAISFVLCWERAVLAEKVKDTRGGLGLFRSSTVQTMFLGVSTWISCLHHVFLKSVTFFAPVIVNQHGPLIFCFNINSSSMLWLAPKMHSNVLPVRVAGKAGIVLSYLILSSLWSPWGKGISKQYLRLTGLHFHLEIALNLYFLISSSS